VEADFHDGHWFLDANVLAGGRASGELPGVPREQLSRRKARDHGATQSAEAEDHARCSDNEQEGKGKQKNRALESRGEQKQRGSDESRNQDDEPQTNKGDKASQRGHADQPLVEKGQDGRREMGREKMPDHVVDLLFRESSFTLLRHILGPILPRVIARAPSTLGGYNTRCDQHRHHLGAHLMESQEQMLELMGDILENDLIAFDVRAHVHEEDHQTERSVIRATLVDRRADSEVEIDGEGVGLIDAFFHALVKALAKDYPSLDSIKFREFSASAETETALTGSRSDSVGIIRLEVENQVNRAFVFTHSSRSITASCIRVTLSAAEYFVNSERAFHRTRELVDDARERQREDLVKKYTEMLTRLVRNTSYATTEES